MEDLQPHLMATDSFSQNWLLNTTYAPFEFSYIRSESEAAECDDQGSVGSFNFGTQLPHWFQFGSEDGGVLYADELFFDGFIKATEFTPALLQQASERESLFVAKRDASSVSSPAAVLRRRFLGKFAKMVVIKCWKAFKCGLKSKKKKVNMCGGQSAWPSGHDSYGIGSAENPIYEAVLHCKRSIGAS